MATSTEHVGIEEDAEEAIVNAHLNPATPIEKPQENRDGSTDNPHSASSCTTTTSTTDTASPKKDPTDATPPKKVSTPLSDFRKYIGMPGDHSRVLPTVNQYIWFIDYMVAELSDNNEELPFEWLADIIHCSSGRQFIISELVREYFKDQVKISRAKDPNQPEFLVEAISDCHVEIVNKEEKTYDKCSILVNYSRTGKPNRLEIVYDEVDQPWVSEEEKRENARRQKVFSHINRSREQAVAHIKQEKKETEQNRLLSVSEILISST